MLPKRLDPPRYRQHARHATLLPPFLCMITVACASIVLTCCLLVHRLRNEELMVKTRDPAVEKKMKAACNMARRKGGRAFLWEAYEWYKLSSQTSWGNMRRFWNESSESKQPAQPTTPAGSASKKTPTVTSTAARAPPTGRKTKKTSHQAFVDSQNKELWKTEFKAQHKPATEMVKTLRKQNKLGRHMMPTQHLSAWERQERAHSRLVPNQHACYDCASWRTHDDAPMAGGGGQGRGRGAAGVMAHVASPHSVPEHVP
jgi:hypothetical protein